MMSQAWIRPNWACQLQDFERTRRTYLVLPDYRQDEQLDTRLGEQQTQSTQGP